MNTFNVDNADNHGSHVFSILFGKYS